MNKNLNIDAGSNSSQLPKLSIMRFWLFQLILVLILAVIFALTLTFKASYSSILGGLVAIIPHIFFARKLFRYQGARAARQIVNNFYQGEALKIVLAMSLFTIVFNFFKVIPLAFFVSYIVIIMTQWLASWVIENRPTK